MDATDPDAVFEESQGQCLVVMAYILGVLLGLSLILLGVVIIGWVLTCWAMKKKGARAIMVTQSEDNRQDL